MNNPDSFFFFLVSYVKTLLNTEMSRFDTLFDFRQKSE